MAEFSIIPLVGGTAVGEGVWLGLREASDRLEVHPATLRQWADRGRIRSYRTPGGHRRFNEEDVRALTGNSSPSLDLLVTAAIGQARLSSSAGQLEAEAWYSGFDESAKEQQRELGRELMRLLAAHLEHPSPEGEATAGVAELGARYAALARRSGLTLGDAMRAFHHFEQVVASSVAQLSAVQRRADDLDARVSWFLNEVRIAMVQHFVEAGA